MDATSLKYISKIPQKIDPSTSLVILIHGYGSNEEDLFSFANELPENLIVVSVRAPQNIGFGGYAWYTIHFDNNNGKFSDIDEAKIALELLSNFVDDIQEKYNISTDKTFLMGFSQGTILSYALALNYPEKVRNIVALSGYLNRELLPSEFEEYDYSKLDFYISHGLVDQVIPVEWAKKAPVFLDKLGIKETSNKKTLELIKEK